MLRFWLNVIALNIGWFACVLGAAGDIHWAGPAVVAVLIIVHVYVQPEGKADVALMVVALVAGFAADSAMIAAGVFSPQRWLFPPPVSTVWMAMMWANLATGVNVALARLHGHPCLAAACGAVGGPSAYYAGARFGAIQLHEPHLFSLGVLAIVWALATPVLFWVGRKARGRCGTQSCSAAF